MTNNALRSRMKLFHPQGTACWTTNLIIYYRTINILVYIHLTILQLSNFLTLAQNFWAMLCHVRSEQAQKGEAILYSPIKEVHDQLNLITGPSNG